MSELAHVDFHGDTLWAVRQDDGRVYVATAPICAAIGVAWPPQYTRLKADPVLGASITTIVMETPAGPRLSVCLPLDLVNGWLFKIDARRVKPEAWDKVIAYQRECYAALFAHFYGKATAALNEASNDDGVPTTIQAAPDYEAWRIWLLIVSMARKLYGPDTARKLWLQSPLPNASLPAVQDRYEPVSAFASERLRHQPGAPWLPASVVYAAYVAWAKARGEAAVTQTHFGLGLAALGFAKVKQATVTYRDVVLLSAETREAA